MDSRQVTALSDYMRDSEIGEQLRNYDRSIVLIVAAGQREIVRVHAATGDGHLRIGAGSSAEANGDDLVVRISADAALAVGGGRSLLEDEFAAGAIALDGVAPDDYRQAPVLERLLEGMVHIGVLRTAEAAT